MICDPRLKSKSYGKVFLKSLPDMKRSAEIADVDAFFFERMQRDI
jgi:ATP-dependent DNA helicase DinG